MTHAHEKCITNIRKPFMLHVTSISFNGNHGKLQATAWKSLEAPWFFKQRRPSIPVKKKEIVVNEISILIFKRYP